MICQRHRIVYSIRPNTILYACDVARVVFSWDVLVQMSVNHALHVESVVGERFDVLQSL